MWGETLYDRKILAIWGVQAVHQPTLERINQQIGSDTSRLLVKRRSSLPAVPRQRIDGWERVFRCLWRVVVP
jgi:hypothetical protein